MKHQDALVVPGITLEKVLRFHNVFFAGAKRSPMTSGLLDQIEIMSGTDLKFLTEQTPSTERDFLTDTK